MDTAALIPGDSASDPGVILGGLSDTLIAIAFLSIPVATGLLMYRQRDLRMSRATWMLCGFTFLFGVTHLIATLEIWAPVSELHSLAKALCAAVSLFAAISVIRILPQIIALPDARKLLLLNAQLSEKLSSRDTKLGELEGELVRQAAELAKANLRFETALAEANIVMYQQNPDLEFTWFQKSPEGYVPLALVEDADAPRPTQASQQRADRAKREVMETGEAQSVEVECVADDTASWYDLRIHPFRNEENKPAGLTCVAIDITERKRNERHMKVVMRELAHRSKNLLAIIISICNMSARSAPSVDSFVERFSARLKSLSDAHDMLTETNWTGGDLEALLDRQLEPYRDTSGKQIKIEGFPVTLTVNGTQYLSLALQELVSNSARYGALRDPAGSIRISWKKNGAGMLLEWREEFSETAGSGGTKPRKGFGRVMLERIVPQAVGGESKLEIGDGALTYSLMINESELA